MARNTRVEIDTSTLDRILKNSGSNASEAVAKAAFSVEAKTKINIQRMDAIDTGAMLNSVAVSHKNSNGSEAMAAARLRNPEAQIVPLPRPENDTTAYVGPTVEYAMAVHFGNGNMAGRPFLLEAVRQVEREFSGLFEVVCTDGAR